MADSSHPEVTLRVWADAYTWVARRDLAGRFKRGVGNRAIVTIHAQDAEGAGLAIDLTGTSVEELRRIAEEAWAPFRNVPGYQVWFD